MQAFEFIANIEKGQISIPQDIQQYFTTKVRVILLCEEEKNPEDFINGLLSNPISVKINVPESRSTFYE